MWFGIITGNCASCAQGGLAGVLSAEYLEEIERGPRIKELHGRPGT